MKEHHGWCRLGGQTAAMWKRPLRAKALCVNMIDFKEHFPSGLFGDNAEPIEDRIAEMERLFVMAGQPDDVQIVSFVAPADRFGVIFHCQSKQYPDIKPYERFSEETVNLPDREKPKQRWW